VDVIEDGVNGLLVDAGDADQLAAAMLRLTRDDGLARRLGVHARRTVVGQYTVARAADQYLDLYRQALAGKGP
jgi:glycosyltransferase involved in cell wall biosynthesis